MTFEKNFGNVIWTNHAIKRLADRGIKQGDAWATWKNPDQSRYAATKGAWIYYRAFGNTRLEVVAKQNEKKEWVILSVWSKPNLTRLKPIFGYQSKKLEPLWKLILKKIFKSSSL